MLALVREYIPVSEVSDEEIGDMIVGAYTGRTKDAIFMLGIFTIGVLKSFSELRNKSKEQEAS